MGLSSVAMSTCDEHCDCIVVYAGKKCPLCEMQAEVADLEQERCDLQAEVEDYEKLAKNET